MDGYSVLEQGNGDMKKPKKEKKKKPKYNLNSRIRSALRQVWRFSPMRKQALSDARISKGRYLCSMCQQINGPKDISVDHIVACGSLIDDLNGFKERLFCESSGLRVLCHDCHKGVTEAQAALRKSSKSKVN